MPRHTPYLQRRGYGLTFRIAIPSDLRSIVGSREITKALPTENKILATPIALEYAACAKRMFGELRAAMSAQDQEKLRLVLQQARLQIKLSDQLEVQDKREKEHLQELRQVQHDADRRVENETLKAENDVMRRILAGSYASPIPATSPSSVSPPAATKIGPSRNFKEVVDKFLNATQRKKTPSMLKKHKMVLTMLLEVVGNKPIDELDQDDINDFFELLGHLPPRWSDACRKQELSIRQLAELEHPEILGPNSFNDTYLASVRPFLKEAKKDWQTKGFPITLTLEGIEYIGDREEGENKQRAFKQHELKRLFEGSEMEAFASDPSKAHCFWLPTVGLYTGARVNEICQLNPQVDIFQDSESGSWCFWINEETDADHRIKKSVKTEDSRKVPIHKKLIELGFLEYASRMKSAGAKLLFPEWQPINRRASGEAEKWFRQLLRNTNLRDETPKATILGMHAFRHTLLTYGAMQKPALSLFSITGHAQGETPIPASGAGKGYLSLPMLSPLNDKAVLLDQLDYGLNFFTPKSV
jgi:integrase